MPSSPPTGAPRRTAPCAPTRRLCRLRRLSPRAARLRAACRRTRTRRRRRTTRRTRTTRRILTTRRARSTVATCPTCVRTCASTSRTAPTRWSRTTTATTRRPTAVSCAGPTLSASAGRTPTTRAHRSATIPSARTRRTRPSPSASKCGVPLTPRPLPLRCVPDGGRVRWLGEDATKPPCECAEVRRANLGTGPLAGPALLARLQARL